jgi:hypothetical protein
LFIVIVILIIGRIHTANAHGIGIYLNGTGGPNRYDSGIYFESDWPSSIESRKHHETAKLSYGCGIMMDTDPDSDRLFNYRIYTGYERMYVLNHNTVDLHAMRWRNNFGFKLYRNDAIKVWLGPQFGFDFMEGKDTHSTWEIIDNYFSTGPPLYGFTPVKYTRRYHLIGINTGLAAGVNININEKIALTVEAGCNVYNTFSMRELDNTPPTGEIKGLEAYVLCGILGRVN